MIGIDTLFDVKIGELIDPNEILKEIKSFLSSLVSRPSQQLMKSSIYGTLSEQDIYKLYTCTVCFDLGVSSATTHINLVALEKTTFCDKSFIYLGLMVIFLMVM